MTEIDRIMTAFCTSYKKLLIDKFELYADKAYGNTGDLIDLGREISGKLSNKIGELKKPTEYDPEVVEFIQKHAFEQIGAYAYGKIEQMRSAVSDLMLNGRATKANVRNAIEDILGVNKSKAEEITQYELSRAYNYGTITRLKEYARVSGEKVRKYWHGFKYSETTCGYCRDRIGMIVDIDDDSEVLPAHIRCRCVWLPVLDGWDGPVSTSLISRANMLNTAYSKDMIYQRINNRLGIDYAEYMSQESASDYLSGDRSEKVLGALSRARLEYINNVKDSFDIAKDISNTNLSAIKFIHVRIATI
jgi:SPP1 gp7 family putative phage head morphogenesis protein